MDIYNKKSRPVAKGHFFILKTDRRQYYIPWGKTHTSIKKIRRNVPQFHSDSILLMSFFFSYRICLLACSRYEYSSQSAPMMLNKYESCMAKPCSQMSRSQ